MWIRQGDAATNINTSSVLFISTVHIRLNQDVVAIFKTEEEAKKAFEKIWGRLHQYVVTVDLSEAQDEE